MTNGKPNALYFSGDTIYFPELVQMKDNFHISIALYNLGCAIVPADANGSMLQITMGGEQGARLFKETEADVLVPMHYMSWKHFTQFDEGLRKEFEEHGVLDKVRWLKPASAVRII
jgi:L-ascorbate metabolism protein UlaG (beta-lactamase superfamily)